MDLWNIIDGILWYVFEIAGIILLPVAIIIYVWLRGWLTVPFQVKLKGGEMWLHSRGNNLIPVYVPAGETSYKKTNSNKTEDVWQRGKNSIKLSSGIPTTLMIDGWATTFSPDQVLDLAEQMANSHIDNMNSFSEPITETINGEEVPQFIKVPVYDENTGKQLMDETTGEKIYRPVLQRRYYPIDPTMPRYKLPKILTSRNLAEQIKSEASARSETLLDQDKKPFYTTLAVGGGIFFLVCIIIIAKWGMEYSLCSSAQAVVSSTTTTIVNAVSTTLANLPPTQM